MFDIPVTLRAAGRADVDVAWERYVDFAKWSDWSPQILGVETAAARIAPGVTGRVRGPLGVRVSFVVETVDELARTWSWVATFGPIRLWLGHAVWARGAGCATSLQVRGPAPVVAAYAPLARFALGRLVRP